MHTQIYLSYDRKDVKIAGAITQALEKANFIVRTHKHLINLQELPKGLAEIPLFLVVVTPNWVLTNRYEEELRYAMSHMKIIIPIQVDRSKLPNELSRRITVHFDTLDQETGLQRIVQHASWMLSEKGEIQVLRDRLADLVYELKSGTVQNISAVQKEIKYLESSISTNQNYQPQENNGIAEERENFQSKRIRMRTRGLKKVVGTPPLGLNDYFQDRVDALADLLNFVSNNNTRRVLTIYGRGGIGKTALACEAMERLLTEDLSIYGQIYLSTRSHLGISFDQIYFSFAALLGKEDETYLKQVWGDKLEVETKIEILIDKVDETKIVLLLDNFEELLDIDGKVSDKDLATFFSVFLKGTRQTKIIITSRERIVLPNDVRVLMDYIPLDSGLPMANAISLLRLFDNDGYLRLKDCDENTLELLAQKTHGFPRALEAIAGILEQDPLISPKEIAEDDILLYESVVESLVDDALSRLPREALYVMQALAVFNRPVTMNAIRFILDPFVSTANLNLILNKLVRGRFIHIINNTKEIVIHPLDRNYSYHRIPA